MTVIPVGFSHIIQPYTHPASSKRYSVTYAVNSGIGGRPLQAVCEFADLNFRQAWRPITDATFVFQPAVMYTRVDDGPLVLTTSTIAANSGPTNKAGPPAQVAVVVRKRTARVGRSQRGRVFMPGLLDETAVDEAGVIAGSAVTTFQNAANAWLAGQNGSPESMVLLHQKTNFPPGTNPPTSITQMLVQSIVRTQRRRLPRG